MEGSGILTYASYRYHGGFERNLPKGPGCFVFDQKYMQHGFYVNLRDPAFDYVGAEELALDQNQDQGSKFCFSPFWCYSFVWYVRTCILSAVGFWYCEKLLIP